MKGSSKQPGESARTVYDLLKVDNSLDSPGEATGDQADSEPDERKFHLTSSSPGLNLVAALNPRTLLPALEGKGSGFLCFNPAWFHRSLSALQGTGSERSGVT